jgi:hypothetical protein
MTADQVRRVAGVFGIVFVIIAVITIFLPGSPPKADEVAKITGYFADKRGSILAANYLTGLAFFFFLLFATGLRTYFGAVDPTGLRAGAGLLVGAVGGVVLIFAGTAVMNGAVFQVASAGDANLNHALYDVANDLFFMVGFAIAVFFVSAAIAVRVTGALPSWLGPAALLVAVLNLIGGVGLFAKSGFFAIGGAFGFIVPTVTLLWILAASVVLLRPGPVTRAGTP